MTFRKLIKLLIGKAWCATCFFFNVFALKVYVVIGNYFGSCLCSACFAGEHVVPTKAPSLKRKAAVSLLALLQHVVAVVLLG